MDILYRPRAVARSDELPTPSIADPPADPALDFLSSILLEYQYLLWSFLGLTLVSKADISDEHLHNPELYNIANPKLMPQYGSMPRDRLPQALPGEFDWFSLSL